MELDIMVDMELDKVADMELDMMADMELDKVADMVVAYSKTKCIGLKLFDAKCT